MSTPNVPSDDNTVADLVVTHTVTTTIPAALVEAGVDFLGLLTAAPSLIAAVVPVAPVGATTGCQTVATCEVSGVLVQAGPAD